MSGNADTGRQQVQRLSRRIQRLADIGIALSAEKDLAVLFEMVVAEARRLTRADAGTLYIVNDEHTHLDFTVLHNDTMDTRMGGDSGNPVTLPPVPLYLEDGGENHANVSSHVALAREMVNIPDVYEAEGFDFTGTRKYDASTGYRSRSMLVLPMVNHEDDIIGVLQLLNAKDGDTGEVTAFGEETVQLVSALASQAAVALTNAQLIRDLKRLLYAFIRSIATAIDAKSPYTKGHIDRVVDVTMRIAEAVNAQTEGPYAGVRLDDDELEELRLAAWMHDVGKITTPEYVVDKSTKLETIFDRIELVRMRFAYIEKSMQAALLERLLSMAAEGAGTEAMREAAAEGERLRAELAEDLETVLAANNPGEFMSDERIAAVRAVAAKTYSMDGETRPYLTEEEVENLCIRKGTLTDAERGTIEDHARLTGEMLSQLPFPKHLTRVPDYAAHHHEKLDGSGYPDGLTAEELPLQARILAVADVFEALTAKDRPYKKPMPLTQALKILGFMEKDGHIDADLLALFTAAGIPLDYGREHLLPEQLDGS